MKSHLQSTKSAPLNHPMKHSLQAVLCFFFLALVPTTQAVTLEWQYPLPPGFHGGLSQVVADGEGGVACVFSTSLNTANLFTIVWIDFEGREVYKKTFDQTTSQSPEIVGISKRGLAYSFGSAAPPLVMVDTHGKETVLPTTLKYVPEMVQRYDDEHGIFAYSLGTATVPTGFIVRYKYK